VPSTNDLSVLPWARIQGSWEAVQLATDTDGNLVLLDGEPIPVASWLIRPDDRIFRWNVAGSVDEWHEDERQWRHVSTCKLPEESAYSYQPSKCTPPLQ
jgi:hypothetical protein